MANCKLCGKELPSSGVCSCTEPKKLEADIKTVSFDKDTGVSGKVKKFITDNMLIIIVGAVILALLITTILVIYNFTGSRGAARKYAKNVYDNKGGRTYYSVTLPDKLYSSLKGDKIDAMVDEFNDENKKTNEDYKVKLKKVKKVKKLSGSQLDGAEKAFAQNAAKYDRSYAKESYSAKKGYIYELTYKIKDRQTKKTKNYTKTIAVVKFKGEGWRIIDTDPGQKKSLAEYLSDLGG